MLVFNNIKYFPVFIFIIVAIAVCIFLDYQTILFLRPSGPHFIRQTDSLSFVANYFNSGMRFFEPKVFDLVRSIDGKAACEFPIVYYITALLYFIFGEQEFILRLLNILIVFTGLYFLYRLSILLLNNIFYALCFTFLFFSSTVLIYYTNNFLPDAAAFGFTFIAWYYFYLYFKQTLRKYLYLSFAFFTLSALIKVTYFIFPLSAIIALSINNIREKKHLQNRHLIIIFLVLFASALIVISWNAFVLIYNSKYENNYFLTQAVPIWDLNNANIINTWDFIINYWQNQYYYQSTFHVFYIIAISGLLLKKYADKFFLITTVFVCLGGISYFLLFFGQFKDHDYYFITIIPCIIFLILNSFIAIKNKFPNLINHYLTKACFLVLCILSLNYGREKVTQRYDSKDNFSKIGFELKEIRKLIDDGGIDKNAKFIIITDQTPNGGLYFINRTGWAIQDTGFKNKSNLNSYIKQGADYVILTEPGYLNNKIINEKLGEKILKQGDIILYKTKIN